jgi:hypothetical protein
LTAAGEGLRPSTALTGHGKARHPDHRKEPHMADWTGSSLLAMRLMSALEDPFATAKIYFSVLGCLVTPYYLRQVAQAIRQGKIGVGQGAKGVAYYYYGLTPSTAATPQEEGNFFTVDLPDISIGSAGYFNNRAVVIHEAVHAVHDMFSRAIPVLDNEASAYIAQAVYCLDNSPYHRDHWQDFLKDGDKWAQACPLALRVLDGVRDVDRQYPADYRLLKQQLNGSDLYAGVTSRAMSPCNGIGGFTPDSSPEAPIVFGRVGL